MTGVLLLGFLIGMRHAVEADHVAAVATLATRSRSIADAVRQGAIWGLGHTLTLLAVGSIVLLLNAVVPERAAQALEFAVGVMLVGLGFDVLRRMLKARIHFHTHRHADGAEHFHAHAHDPEADHDPAHHNHEHARGFPFRALFVGLMHGMAGSAALILLTLETVSSPAVGITYIALFGVGSIAGMAALSVVIAVPLRYSAHGLTRLHNGVQGVIGVATVMLGGMLMYQVAS
ncbi:MAG: urease accessory protein [Gammaproteobacteria bacterium]